MSYNAPTHTLPEDASAESAQGKRFIVTDSASDFYTLLETACAEQLTTQERYDTLRNVYSRVIAQSIADSHIHFAGLFSKLDFCIKQRHVPYHTADLLHMARKDMFPARGHTLPSDHYLAEAFPHNLKATALLIYHLCGKVKVPAAIVAGYPETDRKSTWGKFEDKAVRAVVVRWDDSFIWATEAENNTTLKVCYGEANTILTRNGKADWSYLNTILWEGAQINLVRLRKDADGETFLPELIILEPDLLINVTTIASCFETYAESPYVNLINKIKPHANSMPIHLGNLAGQMLDDTVHGRDIDVDESVSAFVRSNALAMVTCDELRTRDCYEQFKKEAAMQKRNINHLVGEVLPQQVQGYDKANVMLEPSFFCETLGIQGRMDFLHEKDGNAVIIEQKSGKGEFVPFNDPRFSSGMPEAKLPHFGQVLLYGALFPYEFNKYASQLKHVMLLYSKYAKGLLNMPQSQELLLRAIRMRNLIAWTEVGYARDGMKLLTTLTPEKLNQKGVCGTLWNRYTQPQLAALLTPIAKASDLEKAYFLRYMRFIENESLLAKLGSNTKENSGFASIWHDTLEEKEAAGNIYDRLTIASFGTDGMGISSVTLRFHDKAAADSTNFRIGDIVFLYPYSDGEAPDACAQMVNRASIEDIREDRIVLRLRNSQTDHRVFDRNKDKLWAVEHDLIDSSANALYAGMHSFLTTTQRRRDLILSQREPEVDTSLCIKGDYGAFNALVTHAKQARDIFLIIGPPGTGKTSFGLVNLLKEELLEPGANVLLLSYTNRAVDEICSKLVEMQEEDPSFDFLRIGSYFSCASDYRKYLLSARQSTSDKPGREILEHISRTRVFCGTTSALNANIDIFRLKHFSLAIIDESSQILEPHLIGLLSAQNDGREAIDRFALIGDHKQLPAVVQQDEEESAVGDEMLRGIGLTDCRHSLFERLLRQCKAADGSYDESLVYMLTKQGRMHRDIAEFPNIAFYGGRLDVVPLSHQLLPPPRISSDHGIAKMLASHRVAFVASERPLASPSSKTNMIEAEMIAATVYQIYLLTSASFSREKTVGVIVPYRNQISTVRNAIDKYGVGILHDITIDTVERYQGSQRDYIIYGFTIQQPYQLNFLTSNTFEEDGMVIDRKLNVAMTRARLNLVMIGNAALLERNEVFRHLMEFAKQKGGYFSPSCKDYCEGRF